MQEHPVEVRGDQFIRCLRCADLVADGGGVDRYHRIASVVAAAFGWALWKTYMETPWTRGSLTLEAI
jgi:hypothetical protein